MTTQLSVYIIHNNPKTENIFIYYLNKTLIFEVNVVLYFTKILSGY